jgi:DNA polymerase-3 subunit gamma/tau
VATLLKIASDSGVVTMAYLALARQWRPKQFDQLVGQPHVVQSLVSALTQNKVHHAYLFTGTHGVGKTTLARIFAKCLNCETGVTATPCEQCSHCQDINAGCFPDLYEIDAASRTKVEDTRELLDNIPYLPTKGKFKVYLIDEVHMLSQHSFNALLKTLEEPPEHVKFLLATTDPQKLPATILSRCLQFHLSKLTTTQIENQLTFILTSEKIHFEKTALQYIAQAANGSMRDSLSLLDQCIAYGHGQVTTTETQALLGLSSHANLTALLAAIDKHDAQAALSLTQSMAAAGVNFSQCLSALLSDLHQIAIQQVTEAYTGPLSPEDVQLYYQIALIGQRDLPLAPTSQIGFEMVVMRMMAFTPTTSSRPKNDVVPAPKSTTPSNHCADWGALLNSLKLTGPTLALAQHCSLQAYTDDALHLNLTRKYATLLNDRHKVRIAEALLALTGRVTSVTITLTESPLETPANCVARSQEAQQQSAKEVIAADETVARIVKTLDATLIENSIKPLTHLTERGE